MELDELGIAQCIVSIKEDFNKARKLEIDFERLSRYFDLATSLKSCMVYNEETMSILIQMISDSLSVCSDNYIKFTKHFRYILRKVIKEAEDLRYDGDNKKVRDAISESIDEYSDLLAELKTCLNYKIYNLTLAIPRIVIMFSLFITILSCSLLCKSFDVL